VKINRLLLSAVLASLWLASCDMPPDELVEDSETDSADTESEIDSETETDAVAGKTCLQAVLCSVFNPEALLTCFEGLNEDDRTAALQLSLCAGTDCLDVANDLPAFGMCLIQNCGPEASECVRTSIAGALL